MDAPPSGDIQIENTAVTEQVSLKVPKNNKYNRYYYKHRDDILEKIRLKKQEDPEYQAKQKAKEDAKIAKELEKIRLKEERKRERGMKKAALLGVLPVVNN
jgi:hypothetical protein